METVKTAISIKKPLFEQIDRLAHEMKTSRSHIFSLAATEFIQRHKNRKLLEAINDAHDDIPDTTDETLVSRMRPNHLKMFKEQW